jgi:DNA-binding response OmpR family regulator
MMKAGVDDYILKNDLSELAPAIDRALRNMKNSKEKNKADLLVSHSGKSM